MNVVWNIFLHDIKRILKNPIAVLVTIGVCIIPSLYAWFNIAANWDPYKNTQTMPIAVVSEDVGAEVGVQEHDFGVNAGGVADARLAGLDGVVREVDGDKHLPGSVLVGALLVGRLAQPLRVLDDA